MSAVCSRMSCALRESIGSAYICRQRFADVVAEVHGGQAQRIVGLADVEFAFVQLYLHFQHVVLGFESVFMGAFHVFISSVSTALYLSATFFISLALMTCAYACSVFTMTSEL